MRELSILEILSVAILVNRFISSDSQLTPFFPLPFKGLPYGQFCILGKALCLVCGGFMQRRLNSSSRIASNFGFIPSGFPNWPGEAAVVVDEPPHSHWVNLRFALAPFY